MILIEETIFAPFIALQRFRVRQELIFEDLRQQSLIDGKIFGFFLMMAVMSESTKHLQATCF